MNRGQKTGAFRPGPTQPPDPLQRPDWRADRACQLEQAGREPRCRDDPWVRAAWRYLRLRGRRADGRVPAELKAVQRAWAIHEEDQLSRWHLEARLLTGEPAHVTAVRCQLDVAVVDACGKLFFDVGDHLEATSWLALRLLPRRAALGVPPSDTAAMLKLVALKGGAVALDIAVRLLAGGGIRGERFPSLDLPGLRQACDELLCRVWMLAHTLPFEAFHVPRVEVLAGLLNDLAALHEEIRERGEGGPLDLVRAGLLGGLLGCQGIPAAWTGRVMDRVDTTLLSRRLEALHESLERAEAAFAQKAA